MVQLTRRKSEPAAKKGAPSGGSERDAATHRSPAPISPLSPAGPSGPPGRVNISASPHRTFPNLSESHARARSFALAESGSAGSFERLQVVPQALASRNNCSESIRTAFSERFRVLAGHWTSLWIPLEPARTANNPIRIPKPIPATFEPFHPSIHYANCPGNHSHSCTVNPPPPPAPAPTCGRCGASWPAAGRSGGVVPSIPILKLPSHKADPGDLDFGELLDTNTSPQLIARESVCVAVPARLAVCVDVCVFLSLENTCVAASLRL